MLVGEHGKRTHIYSPLLQDVICQSGKNAGRFPAGASRKTALAARQDRPRQFYPAWAREEARGQRDPAGKPAVTCYRCAKLAALNVKAGLDLDGQEP